MVAERRHRRRGGEEQKVKQQQGDRLAGQNQSDFTPITAIQPGARCAHGGASPRMSLERGYGCKVPDMGAPRQALGACNSDPSYLVDVNGTLYFTAFDATNGRELWKTDGTSVGTPTWGSCAL